MRPVPAPAPPPTGDGGGHVRGWAVLTVGLWSGGSFSVAPSVQEPGDELLVCPPLSCAGAAGNALSWLPEQQAQQKSGGSSHNRGARGPAEMDL